jgi:drug/metabolite transporter (DMT)-like permease
LATLIWSINYIFAKRALVEFPPMLASGLRTVMAALLLIPIYFWHTRRVRQPAWSRRTIVTVVALGVLGIGLNQIFFVQGISQTSVSHAAFVVGLTPLLVLVVATLFGQERIRAMQVAGMLLALLGVAVLQYSSPDQRQGSLAGDLMVFCGCLLFAFFTVGGKREINRLGPVTLNTWAYASSAVALLPLTLWYSTGFKYNGVSWAGWVSLFYMGAFSSVLGYLLFNYALAHIPASRASTFAYLQPLIALLLAMIFLGEKPSASLLSGGALVLAGVFVAERT